MSGQEAKRLQDLPCRRGATGKAGVVAVADDAHKAVFRNRTSRPRPLRISREPGHRTLVKFVLLITQGNEDIHIEQVNHVALILFH